MSCLDDIAGVVDSSACVNVPQLVGTQEGEVLVQSFDWAGMFAPHFRKLQGIKSYHHFHFDSTKPGVVTCKVAVDSEDKIVDLRKTPHWSPQASDLPQPIHPAGLSIERQWYLHNNIAEYCDEDVRDQVCPRPQVLLTTASRPESCPGTSAPTPTAPAAKKARLCSKCKQPGHNARSCDQDTS